MFRFLFDAFAIDDRLYQLRRAGKLIKLEPKVFDALAYLLRHRDRVVTKDELLEKLWPGQVVSETALTRCIAAARKAVRDDGVKQKVIETQHGRGYRFIATVTEEAEELQISSEATQLLPTSSALPDPPSPYDAEAEQPEDLSLSSSCNDIELSRRPVSPWFSSKGFLAFMGVLLLIGVIATVQYLSSRHSVSSGPLEQTPLVPLPEKPSLAVLPFKNLSEEPEQEHFSDGLTEDLINDLSKISGLFIISRNTVFTYKGRAVKTREVSKELSVRYVLEGSVRKVGDRVRVTTQLVDATTDTHLWGEHSDRSLSDIFALQDEIRRKIVTTNGQSNEALSEPLPLPMGHDTNEHAVNVESFTFQVQNSERKEVVSLLSAPSPQNVRRALSVING